jgi:hypothetical protein
MRTLLNQIKCAALYFEGLQVLRCYKARGSSLVKEKAETHLAKLKGLQEKKKGLQSGENG